jgi:hypothetical protein
MNEYEIISERCGEPGQPFIAEPGVNVDALIQFGFIKIKSKTTKSKEVDDNG